MKDKSYLEKVGGETVFQAIDSQSIPAKSYVANMEWLYGFLEIETGAVCCRYCDGQNK